MTTYTLVDPLGNPIVQNAVDTGVATAPSDRTSTFTPVGGYTTAVVANDYGIATVPTKRPMTFEAPSVTITIDPGLITNG